MEAVPAAPTKEFGRTIGRRPTADRPRHRAAAMIPKARGSGRPPAEAKATIRDPIRPWRWDDRAGTAQERLPYCQAPGESLDRSIGEATWRCSPRRPRARQPDTVR